MEQTENMDFSTALRSLKMGDKVARSGWNGKGMYVALKPGYPNGVPANGVHAATHGVEVGDTVIYRPYLEMKCVDGAFVPWIASQSDLLADDWYTA